MTNVESNQSESGADEFRYKIREAVAVFKDEKSLGNAVDELFGKGFARRDVSVLASQDFAARHLGIDLRGRTTKELEDSGDAPQAGSISAASRATGEAAAFGVPVYIGGAGSAIAIAAEGGSLATAIAGTLIGGVAGAGIGALIALAIAHHHRQQIVERISKGGLVLWLKLPDRARDAEVKEILESNGGEQVHFHALSRKWGAQDVPLHDIQPDPLLEPDA